MHRAVQAAAAPLVAQRDVARWVTAPMDRWVQAALPRVTMPGFVVPTFTVPKFNVPMFELPDLFVPRFTDW